MGTLYLLSPNNKADITGRNLTAETKWKYVATDLYFGGIYLREMRNRNELLKFRYMYIQYSEQVLVFGGLRQNSLSFKKIHWV